MTQRFSKKHESHSFAIKATALALLGSVLACSGAQQTDHSFYIKPTQETLAAAKATQSTQSQVKNSVIEVNRKVDLLWVVDNSASMEVSQDKLRKAFASFTKKYMSGKDTAGKPIDIRTAVITSDLYLANPAFSGFWNSTLTDHVKKLTLRENEIHPKWGRDYAKLLPGMHDGPVPAYCNEGVMGDFYLGPSKCTIRDDVANGTGSANCLNPANGASMITECVNTVNNDSIHSGQPILSTIPPTGTNATDWQNQLINDFIINVSVGTSGSGQEKGLGSLLQFMSDNEAPGSPTAFFRPGSLRIIVFLSDEDDQTQVIPSSPPAGFEPHSNYSDNPKDNGGCPSKTVDGYTYSLSDCVEPSTLVPIPQIKTQVDTFFNGLDGLTSGPNPNYMVASIVSSTGATIEKLQNLQKTMQHSSGLRVTTDQDLGGRYIDFANAVGNGSMVLDIGAEDYTKVLSHIGQQITKTTVVQVPITTSSPLESFELKHPVDPASPPTLTVIHADGSTQVLSPSQYTISGTNVTITDAGVVQSFGAGDRLQVNYRPHGAYSAS